MSHRPDHGRHNHQYYWIRYETACKTIQAYLDFALVAVIFSALLVAGLILAGFGIHYIVGFIATSLTQADGIVGSDDLCAGTMLLGCAVMVYRAARRAGRVARMMLHDARHAPPFTDTLPAEDVLTRASSGQPSSTPDALLRAAMAHEDYDAARLLRGSEGEKVQHRLRGGQR